MSAVTLSQAVRTNLLSLQNTASLLDATQTRLATGNKVNSALDNPTSYFTAASLNSRAGDLGNLLDSVSNAVQTIQAANDGITSITKLVESAQATAGQAQQLSATLGGAGVTATASTSNTTSLTISSGAQPAVIDGTAFTTLDLSGGGDHYDIAVSVNGGGFQVANLYATDVATYNLAQGASVNASAISAQEYADIVNFEIGSNVVSVASGHLVLTSPTTGPGSSLSLLVNGANVTTAGSGGLTNGTSATGSGSGTGDVGSVTVNGQTVTLANGDNAAAILGKFQAAATASSGTNAFTVSNASGVLTLTGTNGNDLVIGGTAATLTALGLSATTINGTPAGAPNPARAALVTQYNGLLDQIDQLTKDAGYNGNNLLAGSSTTLKVVFNETGTSSLTIAGKDTSATGLGLAQLGSTGFDTNAGITTILGNLKTATDTLRSDASSFGSNLSIVQTRQDFTKALINTLQTGASNLTLADSNEEAANLLALQTRQSLSTKALSLASQSDQNVLRLLQ